MSDPHTNHPDAVLDRRPLASRGWRSMRMLASAVARAGISPNAVSAAGMLAGVGAGVLLACTSGGGADRGLLVAAACLIQLRLVCNLIDGMVAVEGGRRSALGELFNEVPDRVSDAATLLGAGHAIGSSPHLGALAACAALFVAYIRAVGKGCGMPSDFSGPMAKQQRMFLVTLAAIIQATLPEAWTARLAAAVGSPLSGVMGIALAVIILGCIITAARRLRRLADFLRRRGVR